MNVEAALEFADVHGYASSHPDDANEDALDTLANEVRRLRADRLERAAVAAMQGLLANPDRSASYEGYAKDSLAFARALCAELDKSQEQE